MLCGRVGSRNLDDADLLPIFRAAEALGAPVFLHPQAPPFAVREAYYSGFAPEVNTALATFGIGWHYETGVQFIRLVLAGAFDSMPRLQIVLGHWGELVMFYSERLSALDRASTLQRPIASYLKENLYLTASGLYLKSYLDRAIDIVGADRLIFSTDYPYQYRPGREARRFLEESGLDDDAKAGFAHRNWERLTASLPTRG
jgi:predicted TIM-barrel fold metal-dependent hydrolase